MALQDPALSNDKYRATLRATWVADPADSELLVTAIPVNVPTVITVGWNTQYETKFRVEGVSGDNSSNYALTGVTKISGYVGNLPESSAVNCLNNEDYFNQWGEQIAAVNDVADAAQQAAEDAAVSSLTVVSVASSATPTPALTTQRNLLLITALAAAAELKNPTGSGVGTKGWSIVVRIKDDGTARALTYDTQYRAVGCTLPITTVLGKTLYLGGLWNQEDTKVDILVVNQEV